MPPNSALRKGTLGKAVLAGGAAVAGASAFNAAVALPPGSLPNLIGGEEGTFTWRPPGTPVGTAYPVAYTRRGAGPAVLLVHSIHAAAWSYEWRHNVDVLARAHTVYAVDLLGFGRSARPALRYSPALYVALITDFAAEVVGEPCTVVGSSLAGAFVVAAAARDAARFPAVVLVGPTGVTRLATPPNALNDATRALVDAPLVGEALFNALVTRPSMEFFLRRTYADPVHLTPDVLDAYWRSAHQPGARHAASAFVGMQLNLNVRDALRRLEQPVLLTWGAQAVEVPTSEMHKFQEALPHAESAVFERCGSLPHDERAAEWNGRVGRFLNGGNGKGGSGTA